MNGPIIFVAAPTDGLDKPGTFTMCLVISPDDDGGGAVWLETAIKRDTRREAETLCQTIASMLGVTYIQD